MAERRKEVKFSFEGVFIEDRVLEVEKEALEAALESLKEVSSLARLMIARGSASGRVALAAISRSRTTEVKLLAEGSFEAIGEDLEGLREQLARLKRELRQG